MSQNEIVRLALHNRWLEKQGVPDMNAVATITARKTAKPNRMDEVKAIRRVVWDRGANHSRGPDSLYRDLGQLLLTPSTAMP